ncbi:FecR family protein [Chitinophaga tropicalis]|uniref:DUF4974 domain-containing protein n=1 Tax=Chitinophaga tropicalis TaxID=2683588 RepID=A0A7K1U5K5_9BACT|nr:FecR domain-containing protein [Chitinophaga tropicalis]MVT09643.1 DUF4974 domain-containing protein [Chitinophaga tropicalis]
MPVDPEYIEQLVLEEITESISPEDQAILQQLLEQEPETRVIRDRIYAQLGDSQFAALQENLPDILPVENLFSTIKKRKQRKIYLVTGSMATILAITVSIWQVMRPVMQRVTPAPIPSFALKTVVLQLPGGQVVSLGSRPQQTVVDGVTFNERDGKLSWSGGNSSQLATLMVPPGKDYTVQLPDGTEMLVNAATSVTLPLAFDKQREIAVNGEAYLTVASNPEKPFRVQLPHEASVQVLGTAFNVNTYDSSLVQVALTQGAVKMLTAKGEMLLEPGTVANYQPGLQPVKTSFDEDELLSWRSGIYRFDNMKVSEIAPVIERLYNVKVIIGDPAIANMRITNFINKHDPLDNFLQSLSHITSIRYRFENGGSTLRLLPSIQ